MDKIQVLLADDQKLFVDNLKIVLESRTKDIRVLGIAYDGKEAVSLASAMVPEIILMDVRMPVMDGVEATKRIATIHPQMKIIMLTTFDDDMYVQQALKHGAAGYILKNVSPDELISSIRAVREGAVLVLPGLSGKKIHREDTVDLPGGRREPSSTEIAQMTQMINELTHRETHLVKLIALAYDNKQIAEEMSVAEQTVKNSITTIYLKLGVSKRTQLMRLFETWEKAGLISSP